MLTDSLYELLSEPAANTHENSDKNTVDLPSISGYAE